MELVEKKLWMVCTLSLWNKPEEVVTYVDVDTSHVEFYKDWGGLTYSKDEWHKGEVFVETEEEAEQPDPFYQEGLDLRAQTRLRPTQETLRRNLAAGCAGALLDVCTSLRVVR